MSATRSACGRKPCIMPARLGCQLANRLGTLTRRKAVLGSFRSGRMQVDRPFAGGKDKYRVILWIFLVSGFLACTSSVYAVARLYIHIIPGSDSWAMKVKNSKPHRPGLGRIIRNPRCCARSDRKYTALLSVLFAWSRRQFAGGRVYSKLK